MRGETSVDVDLTAFHTDPVGDEGRHSHTWNVRLIFNSEPFRDARALRKALEAFLDAYQGRDLPWWSAEEIARAVLVIGTADPIGCVVTRPGFRADVWL